MENRLPVVGLVTYALFLFTLFDTGSNDHTAIMWFVESGEKVRDPLLHHTDWVCRLGQTYFCFCH